MSSVPPFFPKVFGTSDATPVAPNVPSDAERAFYYRGISANSPKLLYRSNRVESPFKLQKLGTWTHCPTKTVHGVFNTPLNPVWDTVAPKICRCLKDRCIRYSAITAARFRTDETNILGPVVIWIATHPNTTTAENAQDASPHVLAILKAHGVKGVVVEWYEGVVEKLSRSQPLLPMINDNNPTHYVRRFLTSALGMPIATEESENTLAEGSVAFFFHEVKDKHGADSPKVFGVSTHHVLCGVDHTKEYEFLGPATPPHYVRLAGSRRFQRGLDEIEDMVREHGIDAEFLASQIVDLEAKPEKEEAREVARRKAFLAAQRKKLAQTSKELRADISCRNIGHVEWAPEVCVDVQGQKYTQDIGTFEVDAAKFKANFKGNVVDLADKFTHAKLTEMFNPQSRGRTTFKYPASRQLRINGCVTRELLAVPDSFDQKGAACLLVMKNGNSTDLTIGRYAGLEAYLCDARGVESVELAIYNHDLKFRSFSARGDSGSLIFDGEGHMVGILHSGMGKHITFATPAWWAIEQLKVRYPHADFNRTAF
ncbi:hypothetical protein FA95DRAFT_1582210 [Auriscalpium vulgare]|uniref:Uncharacterized protein n=1 Tax=Auriscalpium vulgare TaxID=40419 RepID=A0ACB8RWK7_9AGAM|nr:hypothetical protein FA95DRAFT_1582210 [Auriscalpium vulgare]